MQGKACQLKVDVSLKRLITNSGKIVKAENWYSARYS